MIPALGDDIVGRVIVKVCTGCSSTLRWTEPPIKGLGPVSITLTISSLNKLPQAPWTSSGRALQTRGSSCTESQRHQRQDHWKKKMVKLVVCFLEEKLLLVHNFIAILRE